MGDNKPWSINEYRTHLRSLVPADTRMYLCTVSHAYDDPEFGYCEPVETNKKISGRTIINAAIELYKHYGSTHRDTDNKPRLPATREEVYSDALEELTGGGEWCHGDLLTPEEYKKQEEEEKRHKAESAAATICQLYNVKGGTLRFVHALYKHYNKIIKSEQRFRDDPEIRAERYATCMYGGAGRHAFYEDNDYATSQINIAINQLNLVVEYLQKYCPLLISRYRERIAARKNKEQL